MRTTNTRFQELAEQAGIYKPEQFYQHIDALQLRKFAELIVRECDKYVDERFDECEPWMSPGDLLNHFGIKDKDE